MAPPSSGQQVVPTKKSRDGRGKKCPNHRAVLSLNLLLLVVQVIVPSLYYNSHASLGTDLRLPGATGEGGRGGKAPDGGGGGGGGGGVPPPPSRHQATDRRAAAADGPKENSAAASAAADGTFNGFDVYYRDPASSPGASPLHSTVHCMGENFGDRSWLHRSCEFRNLCFDLDEREFVLFRSPAERWMTEAFLGLHDGLPYVSLSSSTANASVSLGGINPQWGWKPNQSEALEWWPAVVEEELATGYYELEGDKVMVTFHSMAAVNVGHLMWDDFFPIFTLLHMFQLARNDLVLIRYVLKNRPRALWATCDLRDETKRQCNRFFKKFLPLLGVKAPKQYTIYDSVLNVSHPRKSKYVCSSKGAAGIGMLNDHGLKAHGWEKKDYEQTHNIGRGPVMYDFRNYMMNNLGLDPTRSVRSNPPHKIVFSTHSSKDPDRNKDFKFQRDALKSAFGEDSSVIVEAHKFRDLDIHEQVRISSEASIIVTACGGGAVTSMFMPKGGALIVFYADHPTQWQRNKHKDPARLDWDFLNNMGYIRTHWLPVTSMNSGAHLDAFVKLIQNELETISHH